MVLQWLWNLWTVATMLRTLLCALLLCPAAALAADPPRSSADTVILADPEQGRTMGKVGGEPLILLDTGNGTVGKMGKDKVMLHKDGRGNTLGKVGDRKLFCHTDAVSGVTLCK